MLLLVALAHWTSAQAHHRAVCQVLCLCVLVHLAEVKLAVQSLLLVVWHAVLVREATCVYALDPAMPVMAVTYPCLVVAQVMQLTVARWWSRAALVALPVAV